MSLEAPTAPEIINISEKEYKECNSFLAASIDDPEGSFDYPDEDPRVVKWMRDHNLQFNSELEEDQTDDVDLKHTRYEIPITMDGDPYWLDTDAHDGGFLNFRPRIVK